MPETVDQSFSQTMKDGAARKFFRDLDPADVAGHRRLEAAFLRSIARADTSEDLAGAFERMWREHPGFRQAMERGDETQAPVLALAFYTLGASGDVWAGGKADEIFRDHLRGVDPAALGGYTLHFFTYGLLLSGRLDMAKPYLERLETVATAEAFMGDLLVAFEYALGQGHQRAAGRLLEAMLVLAGGPDADLPKAGLLRALARLDDGGRSGGLRQALSRVFERHPEYFDADFAALLAPVERVVEMLVAVYEGRGGGKGVPAYSDLWKELNRATGLTRFVLADAETLLLSVDEAGAVEVAPGCVLHVAPTRVERDKSWIAVRVEEDGRQVYAATLAVDGEGSFVLGGPARDMVLPLVRVAVVVR